VKHGWHNLLPFVPFLVGQFGFNFGDIGAYLEGLLVDLINFLVAVLDYIWQVLVVVANFIFSVLQFIWKFATTLFADIERGFKWIWQTVIKGALTKIIDVVVKVRAWLQKVFGPTIRYLQKIRRWIDWAFNKYVKPVLDLIQHIRQVLTVFRLLGFKWAKKLDALLAKIQQDILKVYTTIRAELNKVISYLQIIADPSAILRRNPLFAGLIRSAAELRNILLTVEQRPLTQGETDTQTRDRLLASAATRKSNFETYYSQGKLTPDDDIARRDFNAELDALIKGTSAS